MTEHHDALLELCAGHALGSLERDDRARLEAHLDEGCALCEAELGRAREGATVLAESLPPAPLPVELKDRILTAVRDLSGASDEPAAAGRSTQPWRGWGSDAASDPGELYLLLANEGCWEETGVLGITVRRLFLDTPNNRMTAMFRMAPGTSYTPHLHAGHEECYVLQGDLKVGDVVMHGGDYQRAPGGSTHGVQSTEQGCLLLISSSIGDELI